MSQGNNEVYTGNPYIGSKIFGPYLRKDGRMHVILVWSKDKRKTVSFPKFLMECHLNKILDGHLTVDHFDGDFTNNSIDNLRVIDRVSHCQEDALRLVTVKKFVCPQCTKNFCLQGRSLREAVRNRCLGKAGPFCSRSCAGKYGALVQKGGKKEDVSPIVIVKKYEKRKYL